MGAGTFKPVKAATMQQHQMHAEWIDVSVAMIENLIVQPRREHTEFATAQSIYTRYPALTIFKPLVAVLRKLGIKI